MSGNISFIFDRPIICKTVKYIEETENRSLRALGFDILRFYKLIADWSLENMKDDVTPQGM
jgi:hypothetical protein